MISRFWKETDRGLGLPPCCSLCLGLFFFLGAKKEGYSAKKKKKAYGYTFAGPGKIVVFCHQCPTSIISYMVVFVSHYYTHQFFELKL